MGWLYLYDCPTRADIIKHVTRDEKWDGGWRRTVAKALRGNVLWAVQEGGDGDDVIGVRFIACYLLQKDDGYWGYKDMDESMHPYVYTCPAAYLDLQPRVDCQEWRDHVIAHNAELKVRGEAARKLTVGAVIELAPGYSPPGEYRITRLSPLLGIPVKGGMLTKLERKHIGRLVS